ncbi:DUF6452 family protein [Flagellimonas meridianipacifica]|uniref:Uncharacterized protein n=1 Tax=Flagellimonas meridianipacifica TaxID=1080225 RepID=A0A2T0MDF9_9FLAO|nr:DUF6452 family protein [Allomuricauda pacifica]PRX55524.1 hypothetical protein CLV81_3937 [Allomuricauda pacifica]
MKKIYLAVCILFFVAYTSSCERDDICTDGDTPLLVLGFFDSEDTTVAKDVPAFRVVETILNTDVNTFTSGTSSLDSVGIPLRTDAVTTSFVLITNSAINADTGEETGNLDTLTITYATRENFISRGCGFVINFDELDVQLTTDAENWIQDVSIQQQTIENSNNVHVKIFH